MLMRGRVIRRTRYGRAILYGIHLSPSVTHVGRPGSWWWKGYQPADGAVGLITYGPRRALTDSQPMI